MVQRTNDQFEWTRQNGPTDSVNTGPEGARFGSFYIYTEASDQSPNDQAWLENSLPACRLHSFIYLNFISVFGQIELVHTVHTYAIKM